MVYKTKGDWIAAHIRKSDAVLDVGFVGQGIRADDPASSHAALRATGATVYGLDTQAYIPEDSSLRDRYFVASAETFDLGRTFDRIYAGDLIEHLSNPGLFLQACRKHLAPGGCLLLTTPNTFNLFNLTEKLTKPEPTVNADHTIYLNYKTLRTLCRKNGFDLTAIDYVYRLDVACRESAKKKFLNLVYAFLGRFTDKFMETLCVTVVPIEARTEGV